MTDFVFIDSGVGGIPYMTALLEKESGASCVYVADNKNFPYGEKSHDEVVECVTAVVEKICKRFDPAVIVLACNTISVNALEVLRQKFPQVQFVGTVPAIKLAATVSQKKRIGLIASKSTCENPYNIDLKNEFAKDCELIMRPDSTLISFIEDKGFSATETELEEAVRPAIDFFRRQNCDVIILGCTHFLNIKDVFEKVARNCAVPELVEGPIQIVDSVDGVVRQMIKVRALRSYEALRQAQGPQGVQGPQGAQLFITSTDNQTELAKYQAICAHFNITFGGNI
ncbi:MAG: glutamate racemase [Treponema sp.]|nr:glutamate racemase [Treponema sp.]